MLLYHDRGHDDKDAALLVVVVDEYTLAFVL